MSYAKKGVRVPKELILKIVCEHYSVKEKEVLSHRRFPYLIWPRQVTTYLLRHAGYCGREICEFLSRSTGNDTYAHTAVVNRVITESDAADDLKEVSKKVREAYRKSKKQASKPSVSHEKHSES